MSKPYIEEISKRNEKDYESLLTINTSYLSKMNRVTCKTINGIAYVSISAVAKEVYIGNTSYELLSGLPKPGKVMELQAHLYSGGTETISERLCIDTTGILYWNFNPAHELSAGDVLVISAVYPIAEDSE